MKRARAGWTLALLALACGTKKGGGDAPTPSTSALAVDGADAAAPALRTVIDPIAHATGCMLGHEGTVLDLGEPDEVSDLSIKEPVSEVERDGATWARLTQKTLTLRFLAPAADAPTDGGKVELHVDAHVKSLLAKSATVTLNGKVVGSWSLAKGETRVVSAHSTSASVTAGDNLLVVRFNGVPKGSTDELAQVDWIRVGPATEGSYAATTRMDAIGTQTVSGVAKRSVSLPAPGSLRCVGYLPKGASIELSHAAAGKGDAEVVVRAVRDRMASKELATLHAGDAWTPASIALPDEYTGGIAGVELEVTRASRGVRALLGEVRVAAPVRTKPPSPKPARSAIVVVLGHAPPQELSPYGGKLSMPTLDALAKAGVVFDHHRASTTWSAGALASALTGVLPEAHGATGVARKLSSEPLTIARAARDAGIQAAFFTANPLSSAAFGFDRDWVDYEAALPSREGSATKVFDDAAVWLGKHKDERFLLVVHARGGHPPWDATAEQLKAAAPENYTGAVDPTHGAEILAKARHVPPLVRFGDADRTRAWALFDLAMGAHDAAVSKLLAALREIGHEGDTAIVVTGDVGGPTTTGVPFGDEASLDEAALWVPLIIKPPDGFATPGVHASAPTSSVDLARTVLALLGLSPPSSFSGTDVMELAGGETDPRLLVATTANGRFSLRQGPLVLAGARDRDETLCDNSLDPTCASDVSTSYPIARSVLRRGVASAFASPAVRANAGPYDATLAAAMRAWGL